MPEPSETTLTDTASLASTRKTRPLTETTASPPLTFTLEAVDRFTVLNLLVMIFPFFLSEQISGEPIDNYYEPYLLRCQALYKQPQADALALRYCCVPEGQPLTRPRWFAPPGYAGPWKGISSSARTATDEVLLLTPSSHRNLYVKPGSHSHGAMLGWLLCTSPDASRSPSGRYVPMNAR